ncbi:MAG TPA: DUF3386 family protein [Roseiflexaceae bacterium]|nr:DUF3386 family protein [Roseiflexaceae bacterium]
MASPDHQIGVPQPNDPAARQLLREATERNYHWPSDFGGFAADLRYRNGALALEGRVSAPGPRAIQLDLPGAPAEELAWLRGEVASLIGHRLHRDFAQGDGRYGITAEPDDGHPFGRRVRLHGDPLRSSYRIRDGMLRQATRHLSERFFTLCVSEVQLLGADHYVAQQYSVVHFAATDGRLIRSDVYTDHYVSINNIWLLGTRQLLAADDGGLRMRVLEFANLRLLEGDSSAELAPQEYDQMRAKRR